jgi:alkylation response protein AidB-like acyl-CoA dehydrogenase
VQWAANELAVGANPAAYIYGAGTKFAYMIWMNGTERDRRIARIMVEHHWGATMVLTEPDAGSDVGSGARAPSRSRTAPGTSRASSALSPPPSTT